MNKKRIFPLLCIALAVLAYANYSKRVELAKELKTLSVKMDQIQGGGNSQQAAEKAKLIIAKVKKHLIIQGDIEPTVATIIDVETLRKKNDFYKIARNGDYLVVTPTRAILYSEEKDLILDVVPVQLQPAISAQNQQKPAPEAASAPTAR